MPSTTPLDLEWFTALGDRLDSFLRDWRITEHKLQAGQPPQHPTKIAAKEAFIASLPSQEHEAYLDWLFINRTCFRFRYWGKENFYREKVFIIRPEFLAALRAGKVKGMSASDQNIALQRVSHVIVPIPSFKNASPFLALPRFHAFPRLETLGILSFYSFEDDKKDGIDAAQIVRVKGLGVEDELWGLLGDMGLRVGGRRGLSKGLGVEIWEDRKDYGDGEMGTRVLDIRGVMPYLRAMVGWKRRAVGREGVGVGLESRAGGKML